MHAYTPRPTHQNQPITRRKPTTPNKIANERFSERRNPPIQTSKEDRTPAYQFTTGAKMID
jgi:hypothetical protein